VTRVALVEDQGLVREGLKSLLSLAGIEVVAEAASGDEALRVIPDSRPDVVLLDLRMPGMSGLDVLKALSASGTLPPTLVLTTFDDDAILLEAIRAGARGYLLKDVTLETLTDAIERLARGETVTPRLGSTIDEQRANDLFRWLRAFGPRFGWRQTSTLTKLQTEANAGALGLIVARRVVDGKSGHIVMVVPETGTDQARRDSAAEVIAPLQSQAGASNFRRGTGRLNWWKGAEFAESAFWIHA